MREERILLERVELRVGDLDRHGGREIAAEQAVEAAPHRTERAGVSLHDHAVKCAPGACAARSKKSSVPARPGS